MEEVKATTSELLFEFSGFHNPSLICVCCLNENAVKNMVKPYEFMGIQEVYADMFLNCFSLDILKSLEELKPMICENCTSRLRDACSFKSQVENSIKKLKRVEFSEVVKAANSKVKLEEEQVSDLSETDKTDLLVKQEFYPDDVDIDSDKYDDLLTNEIDIKVEPLARKPSTRLEKKKRKSRNSVTSESHDEHTPKTSGNFLEAGFIPFRYKDKQLSCIICDQQFLDLDLVKSHVINMHAEEEIKRGWREMKKRQNADQFRLKKERLKCHKCRAVIDSFDELKCHVDSCSKKERLPYKLDKSRLDCPECGVLFLNFQTLNVHMNVHYPNYVCECCGKAFASKERLKSHVRNHMSGDYPCKYCGKVFDKITKREHHIAKTHTAGLRYICPKCQEPIKSFYMRQKHLAEVHNQELKRYKCKLCPQSYITPGHLSGHVRRDHLKERNHRCAKCDSAFYTKNALQMHMVKHDGERIFTCEVCQKSYQRYKTLREHMRIHNNDKRFICPVCGRSFTQKCTLKGHLKVHDKKPDLLVR